MNKFRKMILDGLQERYPEYEFHVERVLRNNGCEYDGLHVKLGEDVPCAPIIVCGLYEEQLEQGKLELDEVLGDISRQFNTRVQFNIRNCADFVQVRDKICLRVINYEKNLELLKDVPYRRFLDLAITYRITVVLSNCTEGSILVSNALLKAWGITESELLDVAYHNTFSENGVRVRSMSEILQGFVERDSSMTGLFQAISETDELMYVADNGTFFGGGVSILMKEAFQQFAEKEGHDIYIIPSSTHELILVLKKEDIRWECLRDMLLEVNQFVVAEEDVLSDHLYLYERETDEIVDLCQE